MTEEATNPSTRSGSAEGEGAPVKKWYVVTTYSTYENKVKVACLLGDDNLVSAADLGLTPPDKETLPLNLKEVRSEAERSAIRQAMQVADGNISRAAELLGVSRPTLYDLLARLGFAGYERPESVGEAR